MAYTSAITELRQILADTQYNKRASKKSLIGKIDGSNTSFVTYDKRIIASTLEVFVNDELVSYNLDDNIAGKITLNDAPSGNVKVQANYYFQWWIDDELKNFLNKGAEICGEYTTTTPDTAYLNIIPGLKNAALNFAVSLAAKSLINYLVLRKHSGEFLIEQDGNSDANYEATLKYLESLADSSWKMAIQLRNDFNQKQGRQLNPAFGIKLGAVKQYGPKR